MNHKRIHIVNTKATLRFKQWSNKGYAAFSSMGKVVHISKLSISLTQWIGEVIEHVTEVIDQALEKKEDELSDELLDQEMVQLIPVVVTSKTVKAGIVKSINKNINCR